MWLLRLYISHEDDQSYAALNAVNEILEQHRNAGCKVQIIDIKSQEELAQTDGVKQAPTLLKLGPPPTRKLLPKRWDAPSLIAELEAE
jgi:hypothetical protein